MSRTGLLVTVLLICCLPSQAWGASLEWTGCARDIPVTAARRCTLIVAPRAGQSVLPARWRLYWTGSATVSQPLQFLTQPGPGEAASVCGLVPASTDDDRLSNTSTVEFCSGDPGEPSARAAYVLLVDPSLQARLRVVEESGSSLDTASSEVTINGGSPLDYPPALRFVTTLDDSAGIARAGVVGEGLDGVESAWFYPPEASVPADSLAILTQTASSLTVALPENAGSDGTLVLSTGSGAPSSAETLEGILGYDPLAVGGSADMRPPYPLEPKDFAFLYANGQYHIFYTWIDTTEPDSLDSIDFGHAVSTNLYNWTQLPHVLPVRPGKFDGAHVWAPTILASNGTYTMFYTGVAHDPLGGDDIQTIGRATSTDLLNWTREDLPVLSCANIPWSFCDGSSAGRQFRDPFVMVDPADPTHDLMDYVTRLGTDPGQQIVGVAHTHDLAGTWTDLMPLWCTDKYPNNFLGYNESPHVFDHNGLWYLMFTTNSGHPIRFKTGPGPLADSLLWSGQFRLYDEVGQDGNSDIWIASEYLRVGTQSYLGIVYRGAVTPEIEIRTMTFTTPPHFTLAAPPVTAVAGARGATDFEFRWISAPGNPRGIALAADLPASTTGRIEVFDVGGRSVARLWDGWMLAGPQRWTWDGRSSTGGAAGSGIYFARVRTPAASRTIRVALLR